MNWKIQGNESNISLLLRWCVGDLCLKCTKANSMLKEVSANMFHRLLTLGLDRSLNLQKDSVKHFILWAHIFVVYLKNTCSWAFKLVDFLLTILDISIHWYLNSCSSCQGFHPFKTEAICKWLPLAKFQSCSFPPNWQLLHLLLPHFLFLGEIFSPRIHGFCPTDNDDSTVHLC